MKTIAQQLNVKDFPFVIKNSNGKVVYFENFEGYWYKFEYDSNGNEIYCVDSNGYWERREYDSNGNVIYCENSNGNVLDNRPKQVELTLEEIANKFGINVSQLKIKK